MQAAFRQLSVATLLSILVWSLYISSFQLMDCGLLFAAASLFWCIYVLVVIVQRRAISTVVTGFVSGTVLAAGVRMIYLIGLLPGASW